ncbi:4Fe-4S cluster-binding domain-containing protein [bacterium]|nr:4Fe-4S cluster-binding domain-containing protein [bacterium]
MKQHVPLTREMQDHSRSLYAIGKVVLFGAGLFVRPAIHSLAQRGMVPLCICDNSEAKQGTRIMEISVTSPTQAISAYPDATVIITTLPVYFGEIKNQLNSIGFHSVIDASFLLASFDYCNKTFSHGISSLHFQLDKYFYNYFLLHTPKLLILPSIDIMITEKCSLKCKDCSNLMQYYLNPKHLDFEYTMDSLDTLMDNVDHVLELRILGGETFMNKEAYRYINRIRKYKNYSRIAVYSNGTIIPRGNNLECLKYDDTYLRISDYGESSKNVKVIIKLLDCENINYNLEKVINWQDCASVEKRQRSIEKTMEVYKCCCANQTLTLLNGKIYNCPFAANAANLKMLPTFYEETVKLKSNKIIREHLLKMLREEKNFRTCEYCAGRPDDDTPLPAAVQTAKPLSFEKIKIKHGWKS